MPRHTAKLSPDHEMEYELFLPTGLDLSAPIPFIISISGLEQNHVNGFSKRLSSDRWALAVPLRPQGAPFFFEGDGTQGDGIWHLLQFSTYLRRKYMVEGGHFVFVGVSNGGSAALRLATLWPNVCCGIVVATGSLQGLIPQSQFQETLARLNGLPIDMYVGSEDECGFYVPMVELERELKAMGHQPLVELTLFPGVGHVCSPHIDEHLIHGKISLMFAHARPAGEVLRLDTHTAPRARTILQQLQTFSTAIGFSHKTATNGVLIATKLGICGDVSTPKRKQSEQHRCSFWERVLCSGQDDISNSSRDAKTNPYDVGNAVEVWSKSLKAWFSAVIVKQSIDTVQVEFEGADGTRYCKELLWNSGQLRRPTKNEPLPEIGLDDTQHVWIDDAADRKQQSEVRQLIDFGSNGVMEYELFAPSGYDATVPTPFIVSVSGLEQRHVNGFSHRLPSDRWVVAVPIRPASSPLFFEGFGEEGDGVWYLRQFCKHILGKYNVLGGRLILVGVSNGGSSILRLATISPELCCGVVAVTGSLQGLVPNAEVPNMLKCLHGLPVDMYVGTEDECGFYAPMVQLEKDLHAIGHAPVAELTIFQGAGHCCSPLVDEHLIRGKILLMMARSWPAGQLLRLDAHTAPNSKEIQKQLKILSCSLGLEARSDYDGALLISSGCIEAKEQPKYTNQPLRIPVQIECADRVASATKREQRSLTPVRSQTPTPRLQRNLTPPGRSLTPVRNRISTRSVTPVRTPPSRFSGRSPKCSTPRCIDLLGGGLGHFHFNLPQHLQGQCVAAHA